MSYARFSYADVYVFMSTSGYLDCCGCILDDVAQFDNTADMIIHLDEHRAAGHNVPEGIDARLWADDHENFVDYPRCQVEGCDLRVTCGSPSESNGYVKACSIAHARTLGGFTRLTALGEG